MSVRPMFAVLVASVVGGALVLSSLATGAAPAAGPGVERAVAGQPGTTLQDQVDLALTVYNSNLALVRDTRQLSLPQGAFDLHFGDIAAAINPATVHMRSLTQPDSLAVLEQNYEYDLLEPQKLLQKYVGRDVTLVRQRQTNGTTTTEEVQARLLALNNGPVWQIGGEIVTGLGADHLRFPDLPGNLFSRPTLIWSLDNRGRPDHRIEAAYLTGGISWSADYVLNLDAEATRAGLDGWVTLVNTSGAAYPGARLQLVAGDLNRARQEGGRRALDEAVQLARAAESPAFTEQAFSEYHLYSLERRTSLRDKETKQIALLRGSGIPIEKRFVVEGQQFYYRNVHHPGSPLKEPVRVHLAFRNDRASNLGMPLPAGIVRVYQADADAAMQFVGEDRIDHTPTDEPMSLHIGTAFDVVAERVQTDFAAIARSAHEVEFQITLRNHKDHPVLVEVREPIGGDWQMLRASHEWSKTSAWSARFDVPVPADGTSVLQYRVRVRW